MPWLSIGAPNMAYSPPLSCIGEKQLANSVVTYHLHAKLEYLLQRPNRVPWTTARTQTGPRTVLVEADASAIDRHAKHGMQPTAQLHQRAALLSMYQHWQCTWSLSTC